MGAPEEVRVTPHWQARMLQSHADRDEHHAAATAWLTTLERLNYVLLVLVLLLGLVLLPTGTLNLLSRYPSHGVMAASVSFYNTERKQYSNQRTCVRR